jgi:hypothetical protein
MHLLQSFYHLASHIQLKWLFKGILEDSVECLEGNELFRSDDVELIDCLEFKELLVIVLDEREVQVIRTVSLVILLVYIKVLQSLAIFNELEFGLSLGDFAVRKVLFSYFLDDFEFLCELRIAKLYVKGVANQEVQWNTILLFSFELNPALIIL